MPYLFERRDDDALWCTVPGWVADVVATMADDLRGLLVSGAPAGDEVVERLFPRAYLDPTEEDAEREWEALAHPDLARGKIDALARLAATLRSASTVEGEHDAEDLVEARIGDEDAEVWLRALNDLRLALGTRLGVSEETDFDVDSESPAAAWLQVYQLLTDVQGVLVEVLSGLDAEPWEDD